MVQRLTDRYRHDPATDAGDGAEAAAVQAVSDAGGTCGGGVCMQFQNRAAAPAAVPNSAGFGEFGRILANSGEFGRIRPDAPLCCRRWLEGSLAWPSRSSSGSERAARPSARPSVAREANTGGASCQRVWGGKKFRYVGRR